MSLKVLFLSRNYPNGVMPHLGLWVEGLVRHVSTLCEPYVVAPVPYCPPLPGLGEYTRFRRIASREEMGGVPILRPRFLAGPGYSLHRFEATMYYWGVRGAMDRLRDGFPFDVIHAHFGYPDGVVAVRLGQRYSVPVVITEHAPWIPWMEEYPAVRRQAIRASTACAFHLAVSRYVRDTIVHFTGESERIRVLSVGVDETTFAPPADDDEPDRNQILFVGIMRPVKGVDLLLRALRRLIDNRPSLRLVVVGGGFYRNYRLETERLRSLAAELDLGDHVSFVGMKSPLEVAALMRRSALLVLPSRAESFGAVLLEALASGTPVVATSCGGPEDIVDRGVGVLVPVEDVEALADGMASVLENPDAYDPKRLRDHALGKFSWERIARTTVDLYHEAVDHFRGEAEPERTSSPGASA